MATNDFFSFELDTTVPADAVKIGHAVNAQIYKLDELVTLAGKPTDGAHYTVGQIRQAFAQRWNMAPETPAFLRKAGGESTEVGNEAIVAPGDELEFRAKDGQKGGLMAQAYGEVRKIAKALGAGGNAKKRDLALKVVSATLPELVDAAGDVVLPLDESAAATVIVLKAQYHTVRYDRGSAHKMTVRDLASQYPDAVIEKGKVVEYITEPDGKTQFASRTTSTRYTGMCIAQVVNEVAGASKPLHIQSEPEEAELLEAGSTLTVVLA